MILAWLQWREGSLKFRHRRTNCWIFRLDFKVLFWNSPRNDIFYVKFQFLCSWLVIHDHIVACTPCVWIVLLQDILSCYKLHFTIFCALSPRFVHFILYMYSDKCKLFHLIVVPPNFQLTAVQNTVPLRCIRFYSSKVFPCHHNKLGLLTDAFDCGIVFFTHRAVFISDKLALPKGLEFNCLIVSCDVFDKVLTLSL